MAFNFGHLCVFVLRYSQASHYSYNVALANLRTSRMIKSITSRHVKIPTTPHDFFVCPPAGTVVLTEALADPDPAPGVAVARRRTPAVMSVGFLAAAGVDVDV